MKKIILAYPRGDSDSMILYDENGDIIRGWQAGDCMTFVFSDLFEKLGIEFESKMIPEIDGEYPNKIDL